MENLNDSFEQSKLLKKYYKPEFSHLFNKIKDIKTPVKREILMGLLDGNWHSELDLIRIAKKKQQYMGAVTLATMVISLNYSLNYSRTLKNDYVERQVIDGKMYYKLSDNYVGLSRAAFNKFKYNVD